MSPSFDKLRTGHWAHAAESLRRTLGQYTRKNRYFKVGATSYPYRRWKAHSAEWPRMEVVYYTTSYRSIVRAERDLIAHGHANHWVKSTNEQPGGEGLDPDAGHFYLYILLE